MMRLDVYEELPRDMREYLSQYGWHFNEKLAKHAVEHMSGKHCTMEQVKDFMKRAGYTDFGKYNESDVYYAFNMYYSDFYGTTLVDEMKVASAVNDIVNDEDGYDGALLTEYYAKCIGRGTPLMWGEYL